MGRTKKKRVVEEYIDTTSSDEDNIDDELLEEEVVDEDACQICGKTDNEEQALLCDGCDACFHTFCLSPPLSGIPDGDWFCSSCSAGKENKSSLNEIPSTKEGKKAVPAVDSEVEIDSDEFISADEYEEEVDGKGAIALTEINASNIVA